MTTPGPRTRRRLDRSALLRAVADHLLAHGLHGFTLRRAAEAAGTTHKVLLDKFGSAENLIVEALVVVREQRAQVSLLEAAEAVERADVAGALRLMWSYLTAAEEEGRLLLQGLGWALTDPTRAAVGKQIVEQYLTPVRSALPSYWPVERRDAVATLIVSTTRGLLIDRLATGDTARTDRAFELLVDSVEPLLQD